MQVSGRGRAASAVLATCGFRHAVGPDVVVTVGPNALLFFWRGHADAAPRARPGPRFDAPREVSRTESQETRNSPNCAHLAATVAPA